MSSGDVRLRDILGQGTKLDCASMWDILVEIHSRGGHSSKARATIQDMRAMGVPVGYVAHGCVVGAYCNADDFEVCALARTADTRLDAFGSRHRTRPRSRGHAANPVACALEHALCPMTLAHIILTARYVHKAHAIDFPLPGPNSYAPAQHSHCSVQRCTTHIAQGHVPVHARSNY